MNFVTFGAKEVMDFNSESNVTRRWQDAESSIVGARSCLCLVQQIHTYSCVLCVCSVKGKFEFRNYVNTKSTKRETQMANVLTALGDKEYEVRYTQKRRAAPLPLFRVRRSVCHVCTGPTCLYAYSTRTHRFDRKCRDYERAYLCYNTPRSLHRAASDKGTNSGYQVIKKLIQKVKAHRCTGVLQTRVCRDEDDTPPSFELTRLQL